MNYEKLVAALRCGLGISEASDEMPCEGCDYSRGECDIIGMMRDAADAIEELQAEVKKYHDAFGRLSKTAAELEERVVELKQMAKRGEWIRNENGTYSCSLCGSWIPNEQHYYAEYCLYCGAKMEVQE